jgi:hypothetical protein
LYNRTTLKTWTDEDFIGNENGGENKKQKEEGVIVPIKPNRVLGSTVLHETTSMPSPPHQSQMPFTSTITPWKTSHRTPTGIPRPDFIRNINPIFYFILLNICMYIYI